MGVTEVFIIAMAVIFSLPYLVWRVLRLDYYAPLVVVQVVAGILLGPGVLGVAFPEQHQLIFTPLVTQALTGIAWWAVMLFVWIAGIELDLAKTWQHRGETALTAGLALGTPLLCGSAVALGLLQFPGWIGDKGGPVQFVFGMGMSCAVTALPVLLLLMEKLAILRQPFGQRVLRYASLDDIAIWGALALILLDWTRVGRQAAFLVAFALVSYGVRKAFVRLPQSDRWYLGLIWLAACGFAADWAGLHFMVGAFLAGAVCDAEWYDRDHLDLMRHHLLLTVMPVYFLSTGLRTNWQVGGASVLIAAALLLIAQAVGKLLGLLLAGRLLKWEPGEGKVIAWLLQTKGLVMIVFANILVDKRIITDEAFTALLVMGVVSTMLTIPMVHPMLQKMKSLVFRST